VRVKRHYDEKEFDVLVIDSAPTGTALRLLSLPEVAGWYMRKFYKPLQGMAQVLNPVFEPIFKRVTGFSLPNKEVMDAPYEFYEELEALEKKMHTYELQTTRLKLKVLGMEGKFTQEEVTNIRKMIMSEDEASRTLANTIIENA
jgi:arsenite-transporting ATPase